MTKSIVRDPISPDLRRVMRQLKLGRMLDTLPERLTLARQQHLSHVAFLELVLADETARRTAAGRPGEPAPPGSTRACASTPETSPPRSATTAPCGQS